MPQKGGCTPGIPFLPAVCCVDTFPVVSRKAGQGHGLWLLLGCCESGQVDLILMLPEPSAKGFLRKFHT